MLDATTVEDLRRHSDGTVHEGAESMRVDGSGKVVDWRCHYAADDLT